MSNSSDYIAQAIERAGGPSSVAKRLEIKAWAVSKWCRNGIPADRVLSLAALSGWAVTPHQMAPDIYPHADDGLPADKRVVAKVSGEPVEHLKRPRRSINIEAT
jgi:DNA-binding transcriptional regulator YdaS (Cro superfamily)